MAGKSQTEQRGSMIMSPTFEGLSGYWKDYDMARVERDMERTNPGIRREL